MNANSSPLGAGGKYKHLFFDLDHTAFQKVVDLNLMGTVLPSQVFGEVMVIVPIFPTALLVEVRK